MAGNLVDEVHATAWAMSAVVTLLAMVALQPLAHRAGWLDHPRGRKDHGIATPVCGGLGIFAGIAVSTGFLLRNQPIPTAYLVGGGLLLAVGLLDDLHDLRWWYRVAAQIVAALVMVYLGDGGPRVEHIPGFFTGQPLALGVYAVPGSPPFPRTVMKGWKTSNPALRFSVASSGCGSARCIRTHRLLPHRASGTPCGRPTRA